MDILAPGWKCGAGHQAHLTASGAHAPSRPVHPANGSLSTVGVEEPESSATNCSPGEFLREGPGLANPTSIPLSRGSPSGPKEPGPRVSKARAAAAWLPHRAVRRTGGQARVPKGAPGVPAQAPGSRGRGGPRSHREVLEAGEGEGAFFVQEEPGQVHHAATRRPANVEGNAR